MKLLDIKLEGIKTLLLDRDGVINKLRPNDYVKSWQEFEFIPEIFPFLKMASKIVDNIIIVTNQRGVGRGLMSKSDLNDIHNHMMIEISNNEGRVDDIFICISVRDDDPYRKPNIGMWNEIIEKYPKIERESTLMIGDSDSDLEFAKNCGIKGLKIS